MRSSRSSDKKEHSPINPELLEFAQQHTKQIRRYFQRGIPYHVRAKIDSDDLMQEFWRTLARSDIAFNDLQSREEWIFTLRKIAKRQLRKQVRKFTQVRARNVAIEREISHIELVGVEETPSCRVANLELLELLKSILSERDWKAINLKLRGYSNVEISKSLGTSETSIRRILLVVKRKLIDSGMSLDKLL